MYVERYIAAAVLSFRDLSWV